MICLATTAPSGSVAQSFDGLTVDPMPVSLDVASDFPSSEMLEESALQVQEYFYGGSFARAAVTEAPLSELDASLSTFSPQFDEETLLAPDTPNAPSLANGTLELPEFNDEAFVFARGLTAGGEEATAGAQALTYSYNF